MVITIAKLVEVETHRLIGLGTVKKLKVIPEVGERIYLREVWYEVKSREYVFEDEDAGEVSLNRITLIVEEA